MTCNMCPRQCNIDREKALGFCKAPPFAVVSKSMLHFFEEPVISGTKGSGAVFFSGCNLCCCYCQNRMISNEINGDRVDEEKLFSIFTSLQSQGAHNINLITATPYVDYIIPALKRFKQSSTLPVVYNCGGYESVETLRKLEGLVDVYLPDFKYCESESSQKYSKAADYPTVVQRAIAEMVRQQPKAVIEDGLIKKGVIIRHLVLPSRYKESIKIIQIIAQLFPTALVSVMSQYTPEFYAGDDTSMQRRITSFEYNKVMAEVKALALDGFCQDRSSAKDIYTPDFSSSD